MFLRCKKRRKDGKEHSYWSIVENRRVMGGRILQRHVLYLGELNGCQEASWRRTVELFSHDQSAPQQVSLFPENHLPQSHDSPIPSVGICLSYMRLERPRQWGACWLGCELWQQLGLDAFWREKLPPGRQGARWDQILQTLVLYRLIVTPDGFPIAYEVLSGKTTLTYQLGRHTLRVARRREGRYLLLH